MKHICTLLLLVSLFLVSCNEDPVSGEKRGNVEGSVSLSDEFGADIADRNGITVRFEEASKSTTTDNNGRWQMTDLPAGIYTVTVSKDGFGTYKVFGYQFVGGGTAFMELISLVAPPTYIIEELKVEAEELVTGMMVFARGRILNATSQTPLRAVMFVGTDSAVSSDPAKHRASVRLYVSRSGTSMVFETNLISLKPQLILIPGKTYYFILYPDSTPTPQYLEPRSGKFIYPSLGPTPSNVIAVKIP